MKLRWKAIAWAGAAAALTAALGGSVTDLGPWYFSLKEPSWKPPDWAFGPIWTTIFALAAISAATGWLHAAQRPAREWIIGLFALNGFLNVFWSLLFFKLHRPDWSLWEVPFLWLSVLVLIVFLWRFSRLASALLLPYLVWVSTAWALNKAVVDLNGPFRGG